VSHRGTRKQEIDYLLRLKVAGNLDPPTAFRFIEPEMCMNCRYFVSDRVGDGLRFRCIRSDDLLDGKSPLDFHCNGWERLTA